MTGTALLPDPAGGAAAPRGRPDARPRAAALPPAPAGDARLRRACEDFEGLFAGLLLRQMRRTVPRDGLFGEGAAMREYHELFDMTLAEHIGRAGGLGIAKAMYAQLAPPAASPEGDHR
jgi:flagellar protein FlgJ